MPLEISPEIKELVLRARAFCEEEKRLGRPLIPFKSVRRRVAAITGVSEKTITRVTRADILRRAGLDDPTPYKPRKRKAAPVVDIELPLAHAIRDKVRAIRRRDETLTVNKLLAELKDDVGFKGSRTSLWKILKRMGVKTGKKTDTEDEDSRLPELAIQDADIPSNDITSTDMQISATQSDDLQSADIQSGEFGDSLLNAVTGTQGDTSIQDTIQHIAAATDAVKRESYDYFCEPSQLCSVQIQPLG